MSSISLTKSGPSNSEPNSPRSNTKEFDGLGCVVIAIVIAYTLIIAIVGALFFFSQTGAEKCEEKQGIVEAQQPDDGVLCRLQNGAIVELRSDFGSGGGGGSGNYRYGPKER